ncbi:hypothetical protein J1N35_024976 [Gossypium stocksii]|uniref:Retrotransposon gag domain-containing protein n=1 Tax=Gossypium stocksii TaxID=47602 RepID=A0A9D3ZXV4_9ROSI|nr:hypothetical protein J1N35_024976 [Gossypium stocksii]
MPKGPIHTVHELENLFMTRLFTNKTLQEGPTYLIFIKHKNGKHLRDFISRFNATTMKVKGLADEWAI